MQTKTKPLQQRLLGLAFVVLSSALTLTSAQAQNAPVLGQADAFAVLGGSAVTNTGASVLTGDLGIWPNTASSITGFPPGVVIGTIQAGNAVALQAQSDLTAAYNDAAGRACNTVLTGIDLGGLTLTPGVYCFASSAQLTGTLTLDAQGNPNAVFIFQMGSTLTTASGSRVVVINGGSDCNVYWQVGSSATVGTGTTLAGNILALTSITLTTGANLSGRALARNGAVTLDGNRVTVCPSCPTISLAPTSLPNGTLAAAYSQTIIASGGTTPYAYTVSSGVLPPGLLLNSGSGVLAGTPTQTGTFTFTARATDSRSCPGSRIYTIVINAPACPTISLLPATLPAPVLGTPYSQTVTASGGQAPYTYTISSGALPPGLSLNSSSGLISGTPSASGSFSYTITATDANGCLTAVIYAGVIIPAQCPAISILPATLPPLFVGQPFSQLIQGSGGTAPYSYTVSAGQLPAGMTLNPVSGMLSGVPLVFGNSSFVITVTDALGCRAGRAYQAPTGLGNVIAVPALSPWSLILLFLVLALTAAVAARARGN